MNSPSPEKRPVSVRLPTAVAGKLKVIAAARGVTSSALVEALLVAFVAENIGPALASLAADR